MAQRRPVPFVICWWCPGSLAVSSSMRQAVGSVCNCSRETGCTTFATDHPLYHNFGRRPSRHGTGGVVEIRFHLVETIVDARVGRSSSTEQPKEARELHGVLSAETTGLVTTSCSAPQVSGRVEPTRAISDVQVASLPKLLIMGTVMISSRAQSEDLRLVNDFFDNISFSCWFSARTPQTGKTILALAWKGICDLFVQCVLHDKMWEPKRPTFLPDTRDKEHSLWCSHGREAMWLAVKRDSQRSNTVESSRNLKNRSLCGVFARTY